MGCLSPARHDLRNALFSGLPHVHAPQYVHVQKPVMTTILINRIGGPWPSHIHHKYR
jgi:hypothetical protein